MHKPQVTIGLITYNGAPHIRRALDSLLVQTYTNFELLISDNASTDETPDICREYAARDPRIRYIRQEKNIGAAGNLYFAPHAARGEYFMWAGDDDWWDKRFVEALVEKLEAHPEHNIAMSSYDLLWPDGSLKKRVLFTDDLDLTGQNYKSIFRKMMFDSPIHVCCYGIFRRNFLLGLLRRGVPAYARHDRILMCEAALATRLATVEPTLFFKVRNDAPIKTRARYTGDYMAAISNDPLARTKYFFILPFWLFTSSMIPVRRKFIVPLIWAKLMWLKKRDILKECGAAAKGTFHL